MTPELVFFCRRVILHAQYTKGLLFENGAEIGVVLEDTVREPAERPTFPGFEELDAWVRSWKVAKETAIPAGRYAMTVSKSVRFGKRMTELLHVPGFEGIRTHSGVTVAHTEGCPLVGQDIVEGVGLIGGPIVSAHVLDTVEAALAEGLPVFWHVVNPDPVVPG